MKTVSLGASCADPNYRTVDQSEVRDYFLDLVADRRNWDLRFTIRELIDLSDEPLELEILLALGLPGWDTDLDAQITQSDVKAALLALGTDWDAQQAAQDAQQATIDQIAFLQHWIAASGSDPKFRLAKSSMTRELAALRGGA